MLFKKPFFWDYEKPNYLAYLLLPLTSVIAIRNFLSKFKKKRSVNIKTICVGNIYVGGTGKTPLVIKTKNILNNLNFKTAFIKKFYKDHIDEQKLLEKNGDLFCSKKRSAALDNAIKEGFDAVLFDDGLQDNSINYDLKFVCFNSDKWIGNGLLLPAGPLREKINSISKYNAVFLNGNSKNNQNIKNQIKKYNDKAKIFETYYKISNLNEISLKEKYLIFSGIGNPDSFEKTLKENKFCIEKNIIFPDHYQYRQKDLDQIFELAKKMNLKILTTEKDFLRINTNYSFNIKYAKIELIIKDEINLINYLNSII